ncbi:hypothetical protein [Nocardioides sp.]|uniref:hypothetical protein n=1 Tax=Nocardioides sp. TaxID=35761 RepID=UPI002620CB86|nr:hypothetical protein [Nocardioides sp.]
MVMVLMAAFVVDIGMQRVARADMQALSDVVALDMSRRLDGSDTAALEADPTWDAALAASVARNGGSLGDAPVVQTELGGMDVSSGQFLPSERGEDVPTAVRVTASTSVDFAFGVATSGGASRSAIGAATSFACYKVGSWAASLDTESSLLLNPVLQKMAEQSGSFTNGATVRALDYRGLAAASVDLFDLAARLGVASLDELAAATVNLKDLYVALQALARPDDSTTVAALGSLAAATKTTVGADLSKVLVADSGAGSLLGARANVLDIVGGSIALLNGTNVANIYLGATLPSMANAGLTVKLTQGPHQYCGTPGGSSTAGVTSDTEQLRVTLGGQLNPSIIDFVPPAITGLLSSVASATITAENYATFDLSVAGTSSRLMSVSCGEAQGVDLNVSNGLATVTFSTPLRAEVRAQLAKGLLGGLVDAVISINAIVSVTATIGQSGDAAVDVAVPPQAFDTPYPTSSGGINVTASSRSGANVSANVELLGGLLGANINLSNGERNSILDTVLDSGLNALLSPTAPHSLATTVFDPLLALIGAQVGGSDVILDSEPALSCTAPRLVG